MPPRPAPGCVLVFITFAFTLTAVALLISAIMTDYWEHLAYDKDRVDAIVARNNDTQQVEWYLDDMVAKVTITWGWRTDRSSRNIRIDYLVPLYGGIWKLCTTMQANQLDSLSNYSYPECISYLATDLLQNEKNDWMTRMQNLAISCAIVCLILLGCATLVGAFGIGYRQISAVLVTAVMYILAATFCSFTLSIMHFKRRSGRECGSIDQTLIPPEFMPAHRLNEGWSYRLGWSGVSVCLLASILWYLLFKIMRYGPLTVT